ncbi:MAG: SDR family NAD(P)-dependent oxidoreductase [Bacteroidota bacterium]
MQTILISGATAGIGKACAEAFAQKENCRLILTGRRAERLQQLADDLPVEVLPLSFDIRDAKAVQTAVDNIPEAWHPIDILVNNAGLAVGLNPLQEGILDDWERMIDTNVKGLLYLSRAVTPLMIKAGHGQVFNIGSIAGKEVYPNGNVYCASKHAANALSQGMRMDLLPHGIKVTHVAPGLVNTEFSSVRFKGDTERADQVYNGMTPLKGEDVAEIVVYLSGLPAHVTVNEIVIMPTDQASSLVVRRE